MIISIKHEMLVFWAFVLCGQALGIFFDFFRSLRKNIRHNKTLVATEDVIFCSLAFKIFFEVCYITNNGGLRGYIFVSLVCSGTIYFCLFSKRVFKMWNFVFKLLIKILRPVKVIFLFLKNYFKIWLSSTKNYIWASLKRIGTFFVHFVKKKSAVSPKKQDVI